MTRRSEWLIPALLILLSLVPAVAGLARMGELARGATITPANARFLAAPVPVSLHILTVIPFSILGAMQFAPSLRRGSWHRRTGPMLAVCGFVAAVTGLWMAHFYPWPKGDGEILYALRIVFGFAMLASIIAATVAVFRRDFIAHGAWMTRAYAIGLGAGTQALTHLPWFILMGKPDGLTRAGLMGAGWVINVIVAEGVIWNSAVRRKQSVSTRTAGRPLPPRHPTPSISVRVRGTAPQ